MLNSNNLLTLTIATKLTLTLPLNPNAQCTPTDSQSAVGDIANCRLRIVGRCVQNADPIVGANRRYSADLNRRKSQSALVGRCVPNGNPIVGANRQVCIEFRLDSTVGGKLTNHSYHFRARLDLAAIFASTGIEYFRHFRHFCFVVSIQPRLKHHSTSFQMQKPPLATYSIAFYGSMQTFTLITQRSLFLGLSDTKLISRSKEITIHWSAIKGI